MFNWKRQGSNQKYVTIFFFLQVQAEKRSNMYEMSKTLERRGFAKFCI